MTFSAWKYLHNITHIDHHFDTVENTFVCPSSTDQITEWNTTPYLQSIQMFALIPIAFGLIIFIITCCVVIICCCNKCMKTPQQRPIAHVRRLESRLLEDDNIHRIDSPERKQQHISSPISSNNHVHTDNKQLEDTILNNNSVKLTSSASIGRYILSFMALVLVVFCIFIGYYLNKTLIDVQRHWDNSYEPYDNCISDAYSIQHILISARTQCEYIKNTSFPSTNCLEAADIADQTETYIKQALDAIQQYLNEGKIISWGNSASVDKYRKYLIYIGLSVLSFIALIVVLLTFCVHNLRSIKRCICCNSLLSMILTMGILVIWIISSIQFALSVSMSDVCNEPQNAIMQTVNITQNNKMNDNIVHILRYYIYCDTQHKYNPLINYTQNAYNTLLSLNETLYEMMPYSAVCDINTEARILFDDYNHTLLQINALLTDLQCSNVNWYLDDITSDLCQDGVDYWYLLYSAQVLVVILLLMRGCCVCTEPEVDHAVVLDNVNINGYERLSHNVIDNNAFISPPKHKYKAKASANPYFTDDDVRKCIGYLLPYMESMEDMEKKADELERNGYKNNGVPLHCNLVRKAVAILKNYRLNQDSQFIHPLLKDIV